jgi:hypothetical protein
LKEPAPGACPGPVGFCGLSRQDAAGDSLGLISGDASGDVPGAVDSSGLLGGDVTIGAVDDEAPGLLQPTMAPTTATASRMLLIMKISSD